VIEAASSSTCCLGRWRAAAASTVDGKVGRPYHELDPSVSGHRSSARAALPMLPQLLLAGWSVMGPHPGVRRRWIRRSGPSRSSTRNGGHACCQSCSRRSCAVSTLMLSGGRRGGTLSPARPSAVGGVTPRFWPMVVATTGVAGREGSERGVGRSHRVLNSF
jgi:hypothetical protein